jgi:hypothetical protein
MEVGVVGGILLLSVVDEAAAHATCINNDILLLDDLWLLQLLWLLGLIVVVSMRLFQVL